MLDVLLEPFAYNYMQKAILSVWAWAWFVPFFPPF